jgi:Ty3 transposon capsid-like protein
MNKKLVFIDLTDKQLIVMTHSSLVKIAGKWAQDFLVKAKKGKREVSFETYFKDLENRFGDPELKRHVISENSSLRLATTLEAYNNKFIELSGKVVQEDAMKAYQYRQGLSKEQKNKVDHYVESSFEDLIEYVKQVQTRLLEASLSKRENTQGYDFVLCRTAV